MMAHQMSAEGNRRYFLSILSKCLLASGFGQFFAGCTTYNPQKDSGQVPPEEFDYNAFNKWYKRHRLYNSCNPHVRASTNHTFKGTLHDWTPGIGYHHGDMIAVAPGFVANDMTLDTGRMGGQMVIVAHYISSAMEAPYTSYYAHLSKVAVKIGDRLKRGQLIGRVHHPYRPKLMIGEGGNWVDPYNYGPDYSYMEPFKGELPGDGWYYGGEKIIEMKHKET